MIFSFLTKLLINRRIKRASNGEFRPLNQTSQLVLLVQEHDLKSIIPVIPEIIQYGTKVTLVVETRHRGELPTAIPGCYPILPLQTYWLLQSPSYDFLKSFHNNDGDVLIDLSTKPSLALTYIAVYSKAQFKIGIPKNGLNFYDFQILIPEVKKPEPAEEGELEAPVPPPLTAGDLLHHALFYWQKMGTDENKP